jgi:two-component system, OmpR family, sensor histidine kinase KdpD
MKTSIQSGSRLSRSVMRAAGATLAAALTTVVLAWLGATAVTAGLVFLVIVVWSATTAGLRLSLYIAVLCAVLFDFYFLPPYRTFNLAGGAEWVAMLSFVACSLAAGRVSERARIQAEKAEQRREDMERLYTLGHEMMLREDAAALTRDLPGLVERIFALDCVALYLRDGERTVCSQGEMPQDVEAGMRRAASDDATEPVKAGEFEARALVAGMRPLGALAWCPVSLSREVATAVNAQVAIALSRAAAMEANARLEAARASERLRAALIDSLTHELRTPLTSIRAAATTLMDVEGLDDAGRADLATIVDEEASRLDRLIGEAVEMAEIDSNVVKLQLEAAVPAGVLRDAVDESRGVIGGREVSMETENAESPVLLDARLLGRVLRHLLENAARYSPPESRIVLGCRQVPGGLEFSVRDEGIGIDAADLPHIFDKFYRGRKATRHGKGTGMGLAIVRALVKAHGGTIEAVSTPGKGTTMTFRVAVEKVPQAREAAASGSLRREPAG